LNCLAVGDFPKFPRCYKAISVTDLLPTAGFRFISLGRAVILGIDEKRNAADLLGTRMHRPAARSKRLPPRPRPCTV
jgi:hypothetical protein